MADIALIDTISQCIAAAAGLGTAAFALVDTTKAFGGGVSNCGFSEIERVVALFFPKGEFNETTITPQMASSLGSHQLMLTLRANWLNGTALEGQKAIAKSLLKLRFSTATAGAYATATGMNAEVLASLAEKISNGTGLTLREGDAWARFDLMLTAILDQGYERGDQIYRNSAKALSVVVSIGLAVVGFYAYDQSFKSLGVALLVGLAATPVAPVAKDLTSAIAAGAKAAEAFRK
ncbi:MULTISPECIES: hypothetical protein [unclassified Pseudomonas]|uniref:hypothetical protein n=1 Tax=unclassified Pseudomonas TaxID=196821 RepID=UPI002AC98E33|nr:MULTISPECIES: hypothetical protein [unclassified Pseudomonas]MEB0040410.1 hypothetical protein [Pseudomonas sp. MH10]MEB0078240.1 hypothetical protein [Pseudomonas sp. MH10out]MEB0091599.1 hypothetical protein [Pseudomonas sp. CCI4.2]MEB0099998.1 hypothetical protein [Pseudomonas sp. CCI3.2]MEB0120911.1 hypothetical protein [Pseudomonas sp. CCI1.2]